MDIWYKEIKETPPDIRGEFALRGLEIGHFTQMVWADTNRIGCGFTIYELEDGPGYTKAMYACNYAPQGNTRTYQVYRLGDPVSQCPENYKASSDYPSLCAPS